MSKKSRKHQDDVKKSVLSRMDHAMCEADDFLETAIPFEISMALAELGVSTTHRAGIIGIIERVWKDVAVQTMLTPAKRMDNLLRGIFGALEAEIKARNRTIDFEDRIFLTQAIVHFLELWADADDSRGPARC